MLRAAVNADLALLPEFDERFLRLNAEEPIRLKLSLIRTRLRLTRDSIATGSQHVPHREYRSTRELLDDLMQIRASLTSSDGSIAALGVLDRAIRVIAAIGLPLATLDIREHADKYRLASPPGCAGSSDLRRLCLRPGGHRSLRASDC